MEKKIISKQAVRQVLLDYWQQYKNKPIQTIVAFFLPAIGSILIFFVPPLIVARIINMIAANRDTSLGDVGYYVALLAGLWLLGELFYRIGIHYLIKIETRGMNNLAKSVFERLSQRDYDFYANHFVGSLVKKGMAFSRSFEMFTDTISFNVVSNIFPIIFAVVILWQYSPWIPLVLLFWIGMTIVITLPIIRERSILVTQRHEASSLLSGRFSDAMTNMLAVKSFAQEGKEMNSFGMYVDSFTDKSRKASDYQNLRFDTIIGPIYIMTNVFGLLMAVFFAQKFGLPAGTIVVVFSYYSQVTRIFWEINRVYRNIESSITEAAEFTQLIIEEPLIQDSLGAGSLNVTESTIVFHNVGFKYEPGQDKDKLFLNNFNLEIKGNQKVGLVGPSGGGKTTITKLLLRFIDVRSGSITINGQDIRTVTQASLRQAIAYVPQEPLLFHRSLFENIAYGDNKATKEEVFHAAELARADEFIARTPHGYETLVGERGVKLSGGQRQRVAIARALLKKSPIIILDEATSSLDSESEKYIQEGLWELMKNKTAIVIAHRLSTIKHLDRIIVLDDGKIVQDGTHEELVKQKGLYAKLWSHQSGGFLENLKRTDLKDTANSSTI